MKVTHQRSKVLEIEPEFKPKSVEVQSLFSSPQIHYTVLVTLAHDCPYKLEVKARNQLIRLIAIKVQLYIYIVSVPTILTFSRDCFTLSKTPHKEKPRDMSPEGQHNVVASLSAWCHRIGATEGSGGALSLEPD